MDGQRLLAIYLNDHLLGASGGVDLAERAAGSARGTPAGPVLQRLAVQVAEDRRSLLVVMRRLGVRVRPYKVALGWTLEKLGRVKTNGRLVSRSPLSDLVELEGLRLGVQGKEAGWLSLAAVADRYDALDRAELERLAERARGQAEELEQLRISAATRVLCP